MLEVLPEEGGEAADGGGGERHAERGGTQGPEPERREGRVRPVYPASEQINSQQIERVVEVVLDDALKQIPDHLPPEFRKKRALPELAAAYRMAHQPASLDEAREATRRLAYDELLMLQLGVFLRRAQLRGTVRAPVLHWSAAIDERIRKRFPWPLTGAPRSRVVRELVGDLTRGRVAMGARGPAGRAPMARMNRRIG